MRIFKSFLLIVLINISFLTVVFAKNQGVYFGAKTGIAYIDLSDIDDGTTIAGYGGYQINRFMSTEIEIGKFEADNNGYWGGSLEGTYFAGYFIGTIGNSTLYGKAKIGLLYEDVEYSNNWNNNNSSDIGLSIGIGGGVRIGEFFEINSEIVLIEQDVVTFSIGAKIRL